MGGGSSSKSNSSSTTTYKKTTTTNPYVTSVSDNYGTTTKLNDGTAYKSIYDYTNKNMDELLEEYRNPTLDTPTNQVLLQNYTDKLNKQSREALENNVYNLSFKEGTSIVDVPSLKQIKNDHDLKFLEHPFDAASYLVDYYFPIK